MIWKNTEEITEEKNIKLKLRLRSVIVYADEMKISQVIYNFLSNAIKHSDDNSVIEINMYDSEEKVRVEVKDYGDGISKEAIPYIWDRYYKIDKKNGSIYRNNSIKFCHR